MRAIRRYWEHRGRTRDDMAEGCEEKFDFEFFRWIMFGGRAKRPKAYYRRVQDRYSEKVLRIRSGKELAEMLAWLS